MSTTDYSGPERRRGGPDRRNPEDITRILIVDDHALFRVGIANILGGSRTSRSSARPTTPGAPSTGPSRPRRTSS